MVRAVRNPKLDTRTARLRLEHRKNPYWAPMEPAQSLGYYRPEGGGPGTWTARYLDPMTRKESRRKLGIADDFSEANGLDVLTFSQAQHKAREWFDQAKANFTGEVGHRGPFTVAHAMEVYLTHMDEEGKRSARDARIRAAHHILPALGAIEVDRLTRRRLEKWRNDLADSPRLRRARKRPLPTRPRKPIPPVPKNEPKPQTSEERRARKASANRVLSTLKAALTYAKTRGYVRCSDDAWRSVKPFRAVEEARQAYMTPIEQQRLLNAIEEADFKRLVIGALLTGCRYGELTRMKVGDFESSSKSILIRETKSGKPRRAVLTDEGKSFFEGVTAGRSREETIFVRDQVERRSRKVEGDVNRWRPADQCRKMHEACERAGLPRMGFHQLRHSYASALVSAGMPLAYVAQLTGHADIRMLERHYAHLAPSDISRSLEALAPKLGIDPPTALNLNIKTSLG